jgi:uncharacterized lipoprotein YehR (DUF1307 family)
MKLSLMVVTLFAVITLSACGGSEKASAHADAALQKQADVAKATLQEKADAMARQASMSPPPATKK